MTCDRVLSFVEEFVDGELNRPVAEEVAAHIAGCAACSAEVEALEHEHAMYARYDRGFEPSPRMWEAVQARIEQDIVRHRDTRGFDLTSWMTRLLGQLAPSRLIPLAAAAAALVVTVSVGMWIVRSHRVAAPPATPQAPSENIASGASSDGRQEVPVVQPRVDRPTGGTSSTPRTTKQRPRPVDATPKQELPLPVVHAEQQYLQAIAVLTKDVHASGSIDAKLQKPLDDIDRNILAARKAVVENPKDTEAVLNMLSAYDQKVEVLQSLARFQVARNR